jgi:PAT family beta-lactamase induction signal transducer AmpG
LTTLEYEAPPKARLPINPWLFVPVLYFMQSIPNILATESSVAIYKDLGVDNLKITFWTSIIGLPWSFKLFWGPLVDLNFTKRSWTVAMQVLITGSLAIAAAMIPTGNFFWWSLLALFFIAMFSATHDIACDGLYLMSLDKRRQAAFSGVMATCSRLGRMFISFGLLYAAGKFQSFAWQKDSSWAMALSSAAAIYGAGMLWNIFSLPRPADDVPAPQVEENQNSKNLVRTLAVVATGVCLYFMIAAVVELIGFAFFRSFHGTTYDIAMATFDPGARKAALALLAKPLVPINWHMTPGELRTQLAWLIGGAVAIGPAVIMTKRLIGNSPMGDAFATYFRQSGFGAILAFIMLYRFGEAMILKIVPLFFLDKREFGGMGISVGEVGKIYGFGLPLGLIFGGLAGGAMIARVGLRKAFWPLVICMHVPNLLYVLVAWNRPENHVWLYPVAFIEAFGYGFGFAGYFVYLMYVAQRRPEFRTSHYAIGTGLGALFITFAGILSGILQQTFGYVGFFIAACLFTVPGTLTLLFIPMDEEETKSVRVADSH